MRTAHQIELERLGLSAVEAQIYLALLAKGGTWGASAVAATMAIPRSTVYLTLNSLVDMGLLEVEAGYGGRFSAVPAEQALPSLVLREREDLVRRQREVSDREQVAQELARRLRPERDQPETTDEPEIIQVLRDPRAIAARFERLQLEAERQVEVFIKAPIFNPRYENATQQQAMRRGVHYRALYERAIVDTPEIKPYLAKWIQGGEEARVYDGELPHKLAIFDRQKILMPLIPPGGQGRTLFVKSPQLGASLGMLFESLWQQSQPLTVETPTKARPHRKNARAAQKQANSTPLAARNGSEG